jgi:hypothetical protein
MFSLETSEPRKPPARRTTLAPGTLVTLSALVPPPIHDEPHALRNFASQKIGPLTPFWSAGSSEGTGHPKNQSCCRPGSPRCPRQPNPTSFPSRGTEVTRQWLEGRRGGGGVPWIGDRLEWPARCPPSLTESPSLISVKATGAREGAGRGDEWDGYWERLWNTEWLPWCKGAPEPTSLKSVTCE